MINTIAAHAKVSWDYVTTHRKESADLLAITTIVTSVAYVVFGKKALVVLACGAYAAFYFRDFFSITTAKLISAVVLLPLCGSLNLLAAIPPTSFLMCHIFQHVHDQRKQISQLKEQITALKKTEAAIQKDNATLQQTVKDIQSNNQILAALAEKAETQHTPATPQAVQGLLQAVQSFVQSLGGV